MVQSKNISNIDNIQSYNIEAEQIILGYILINPNKFDEINDNIRIEFFFDNRNKNIYSCMVLLAKNSITITHISLNQELISKKLDYYKYIKEIIGKSIHILNIGHYIELIKNLALKRGLLTIANNIITTIKDNIISANVEKCLSQLDNDIYHLMENGNIASNNFTQLHDAAALLISDIGEKTKKNQVIAGYKQVDNKIQGFKNGDLIILAARPGMGKTTLAINFAYNNAITQTDSQDVGIAIFSLEMSTEQITNKILSLEAQVDSSKILSDNLSETEYNQIRQAMERLKEINIFIDDSAALTIDSIRSKARKLKRSHKISFLIIDYLQLIQVENKYNNRVLEISQITQALKALAKELNIPILTLSQLSRSVESRVDKKPLLSDLRDSGSIEQDADIVLFIYRQDYYSIENTEQTIETSSSSYNNINNTEVIIAKNRNGPTGIGNIQFIPRFSQFIDI